MKKPLIRLAKLLSQRGICSRREAEEYIEKGLVEVDGKIIDRQGTQVSLDAKVVLLKEAKVKQKEKVSIILNKPVGYVSNMPEKGYPPAISLITYQNCIDKKRRPFPKKKLAVVGRLDIDSKGLLLFTQDGTLAKAVIGQDSAIEKEYLVHVKGKIDQKVIDRLCFGLSLDNKKLKKAQVKQIKHQELQFILKEGKKRQIRKMCEMVGLEVVSLKRVRIGPIELKNLPLGKWRFLKEEEILSCKELGGWKEKKKN